MTKIECPVTCPEGCPCGIRAEIAHALGESAHFHEGWRAQRGDTPVYVLASIGDLLFFWDTGPVEHEASLRDLCRKPSMINRYIAAAMLDEGIAIEGDHVLIKRGAPNHVEVAGAGYWAALRAVPGVTVEYHPAFPGRVPVARVPMALIAAAQGYAVASA